MARKSKNKNIYATVIFTVLFVLLFFYALSLLMPMVWALITTFKTPDEYLLDPLGLPAVWQISNYAPAFKHFYIEVFNPGQPTRYFMIWDMFVYSLLYSLGCAFFATLVPCVAAYMVARYKYRFGKVLYWVVIVTMILPIVGALPAEMNLIKGIGLHDSFAGVYLLRANFLGMYFLVFHAQFSTIPYDFTEAAKVDGASQLRIFLLIIFPMALNTFGIVMLLRFIEFWNDYQIPMVYLPSKPVVSYGMYRFYINRSNELSSTPVKLAGVFLMTLPILLVFIVFSKKLVLNVSVGGLKG